MKIEISKEQLNALIAIINNTQIKGADAKFIVELIEVVKKGLNEEQDKEKVFNTQ